MAQVIKCCAYGCTASLNNSPLNNFYRLTEVRASLTEWLLALKRQEILMNLAKNRPPQNLSICDKHFPSLRAAASSLRPLRTPTKNTETQTEAVPPTLMGAPVEIVCDEHFPSLRAASLSLSPIKNPTKNTETQTEAVPPTLMGTLVEIVDIPPQPQPEPLQTFPINIPTIIPPPNMVCAPLTGFLSNLNPDLQNVNNNIPGFIGIAPLHTMAQPTPITSQLSAPILPRILPKPWPSASYVFNLSNLPPAQPVFNIIDVPGMSTASNNVQQRLNVNVPVTNCSVTVPAAAVTGDYEVEVKDEPILIEDDANHESDCDSDIVKLKFPDGQDQNEEGINFVSGTSNDNLETYCFFEDEEVGAKRRRVQSTNSSFQIVKLEVDQDRPIT